MIGREKKMDKKIDVRIILAIIFVFSLMPIGLFGTLWIYALTNDPIEFKIDFDDQAIQVINQTSYLMYTQTNRSCMQGCYYAFENIAQDDSIISMDGFYKDNCIVYCNVELDTGK